MEEKVPFIRVTRRQDFRKSSVWMIRILAFVVALLLGSFVFLLCGVSPIRAYSEIVKGAFGKLTGIRQTVKIMIPLLGTALALAPCFKMKYWNIGAEGQITMGAIGAAFFAINFADRMPSAVLLPVMALAGMILGGIWSLVPAFFKAKWGTNETLFTLMLNYIAIGIVAWLQGGPWEGKEGSQIVPNFSSTAVLPKVGGIYCGWIIVLVLVFFMYFYMNRTKHGYEIAVLGDSENTARYAGMDVTKVIVRTAMISGAISGLVGFMLASGANQTIYSGIAANNGFTAITVAWLSQLNPFAMVLISLLLAGLSKGSSSLKTAMGVPGSISDIITGIILLCLLGCEFFINYRLIFRHKEEK
ncbi:MAG: ABC transporter permease [Bulleidia sp.]